MTRLIAIDLFSGIGGLTAGMEGAGFETRVAIELEPDAVRGYKMNFPETEVFERDIRRIDISEVKEKLEGQPLHLLVGCPPCQGFSSIRKLNRKASVRDNRNSLVEEYFRMVKELKPLTIMME
ncbi:MAG: DNA cytosine methyltransferase, partial [Candidatus Paceibacterota bacterium]